MKNRQRLVRPVVFARLAALTAPLAVALAMSACHDVTAPHLTIAVSVTQVTGPAYSTDSVGKPVISCGVRLRAVAAISGADHAVWSDAVFRWYWGPDRSTPLDSSVTPSATVRTGWAFDDIGPGESRQSSWRVAANAPMGVTIVFRYQQIGGGWVDSTSVSFSCGPTPEPGAPPPAITTFATGATGTLQPSDTVFFDYAATSAVGLWQTVLRLTGSCETRQDYAENFQTATTRRLRLILPAACPLGVPLNVSVTARDPALRETVRSLTLPALVDTTPPVTFPTMPGFGVFLQTGLRGAFFVGDSLAFEFRAMDNHALAMLTWEVQPFGWRDSIAVSGAFAAPIVRFVWRSEWIGQPQFRFWARDASGHTSAVVETAPNAIRVYPSSSLVPSVASVPDVWDVEFSPRGNALYLLQTNSRRIAVFSLLTMSVTSAIDLPGLPTSFDLTVSGDSLVTALRGVAALGVVDLLSSPPTVTMIPILGLDSTRSEAPRNVRVAGNGKALITTMGAYPGAEHLITVDLATGAQRLRLDAGNAGATGTGDLEHSPERSAVILNGGAQAFQRYDAATDAFGPGRTVINGGDIRVGQGANRVAVSGDIYDADLQFVLRIGGGGQPAIALSPDGSTHYMVAGNTAILRSRVSDGGTIDRMRNLISPLLLCASPDGRLLVTVERGWGFLSIFTLR